MNQSVVEKKKVTIQDIMVSTVVRLSNVLFKLKERFEIK